MRMIHRVVFSTFCTLLLATSALLNAAPAAIIKSPNDDRLYRAFTLDNGLQALVISDPGADQAAASLNLNVGSGNDPEEFLGLAHFLEHMLFLGTEKYPEADAYQKFISSHGGSHNAFTAHDQTNYFFNVDQQHLEPALDRFSQFFVAPLFTPEYVEREKNAVHSEYQSKLKDDARRGFSVFRQAVNPAHPLSKFAVGSLETLADKPNHSVREALLTFYQNYYAADRMSLVVLGRQSLDQLESMVSSRFSAVPAHPTIATPEPPPLFTAEQLPALMRVQSIQEKHKLSLQFPVPPINQYYREKPVHYISSLLGDEGDGSLLQVLKEQGWVRGLSAGPGFNYADAATMMVNITLTPKGYQHYQDVLALTFDYIELIKNKGVSASRFAEEQSLSEINFRFEDKANPVRYVTRLSHNLRTYPIEEVIHGDYLFAQYNPELIQQYLEQLNPENVLVTLTSAEEETDQIDPWYQTPYSLSSLSLNPSTDNMLADLKSQLALRPTNPFIPEDLSIRTTGATSKPAVIEVMPGFRLWHQLDGDFPSPKSNFYFTFRSPIANDSPLHHVSTMLFVELVNEELNSFLYPAYTAGQSVNLYNHIRGFSMRLSGFRDKQPLLLEQITASLKNLSIDPQKLALAKDNLRRKIANRSKDKPYQQALAEVYQSLLVPRWSDAEQLQALNWVTPAQLQSFTRDLLHVGELEALAHGNLSQNEARALAQPLLDNLHSDLEVATVGSATVRELPDTGVNKILQVPHTDSALTFYVQSQNENMQSRANFQLLEQLISSEYYTQLRTEEQLGYIVFASFFPVLEHPGIAFIVQSPVASADQLEARTQQFIDQLPEALADLTEKQLEVYKQSLLAELLKQEQTLQTRTNRYWQEIDRGYAYFDSREWVAKAIKAATVKDLQATLKQLEKRQLVIKASPAVIAGNQ